MARPKADPGDGVFQRRRLNVTSAGGVTLLDAVQEGDALRLFFKSGTPQDEIALGAPAEEFGRRSVGEAPMLYGRIQPGADEAAPLDVTVAGQRLRVTPTPAEPQLFAGLNLCLALRNGEPAKVVLDWLSWHQRQHGMDGALIVNRAKPGRDKKFIRELEAGLAAIPGLRRVLLLDADVPLGKADLPPEAHPFNVIGAPGKDRMKIPAPDPWSAPLGEVLLYELLRARFLTQARTVANIDVFDLIESDGRASVFDRAVAASTGCIALEGAQCYPWRVRKGQEPGFGDHICVQFDAGGARRRWCVAPQKAEDDSVWRLVRVVGTAPGPNESARFHRHMALRHPAASISKIVPKTSLVEDEALLARAQGFFAHDPVRMPEEKIGKQSSGAAPRITIVTTMKNEGPFILEWIAYHRMIGVTDFLVYTNDCSDGTDTLLDILQQKGIVQHRDNPFRDTDLKPQHAALQAAEKEKIYKKADWLICMDVDEYISIKAGQGRLADLFAAVGDANMIAITWRLFGNSDIHEYRDGLLTRDFTRCAPELIRKPHQAWGFKTLFRNQGIFKKLGVHRPKGLKPQLWEEIRWVNGSGRAMPQKMYRNGWRSTTATYGYDLVTLNHYAVRSAESFLVKRDRGRVNHVDRDQGLAYWFRMNNNAEEDLSIQRMLPALREEMDRLLQDPQIAAAHANSVKAHRRKIDELRATENYAAFYAELTSPRMERLSRMHARFGANVFLAGPQVVPDEIVEKDPDEDFFFTVEKGETAH